MFEDGENNKAEMAAITEYGAFIIRPEHIRRRHPARSIRLEGLVGASPPYHTPVFVLTHHPRESITMEGGTTFHFVSEGADVALELGAGSAGRPSRGHRRRRATLRTTSMLGPSTGCSTDRPDAAASRRAFVG